MLRKAFLLSLLVGCGSSPPVDYGPAPAPSAQVEKRWLVSVVSLSSQSPGARSWCHIGTDTLPVSVPGDVCEAMASDLTRSGSYVGVQVDGATGYAVLKPSDEGQFLQVALPGGRSVEMEVTVSK